MGYTIFEKQYPTKSVSPTVTISPLGRCTLNRAAAELFNKDAVENVLLLWDAEAKRFAMRPIAKKDHRAFAVRYGKNEGNAVVGASFSGVMFLRHIGYDFSRTGTYAVERSNDGSIYEVQLPMERFGIQLVTVPVNAPEGRKRAKVAAG